MDTLLLTKLQETLDNYTAEAILEDDSHLFSFATFKRVSARPTRPYYDHSVEDTVVEGDCTDWTRFWRGGNLEEQLYGSDPVSIQIFTAEVITPEDAPIAVLSTPRNITCSEVDRAREIVEQITQTALTLSSDAIVCDAHSWVIKDCDNSGSPVICVDCPESVLADLCGDSGTDTSSAICDLHENATYIGPCQNSLCSTKSPHSMGHLFVSRSTPNGLAPELLSASIESSNDGKAVSANLAMDEAAIVTCISIESDGSGVPSTPSTVSEVLLTGETASTQYVGADGTYSVTVKIDGLVPSTEYYIYCATVSSAGNVVSYDDMVSQSQNVIGSVTTSCCRII